MLAEFVHLPRIGNYQKTGEVVLVGLNAFLQHFHSVAYTDGKSKMEALLAEIARAKHHIHILYYIFCDDTTPSSAFSVPRPPY